MITCAAWAGKTFGVYGLARTGKSVAAALTASGAAVAAWDDGEAARTAFAGELTDLHTADLSGLAAMVVSPGVPHDAPVFRRAVAAGIPVIGDIELFAQARASLPRHKVVGVTGTNGKSTTAALIHHILVTAGVPARLGGNIGAPILSEEPLPEGGVYVLELSSFQLELTYSLVCEVAVLLNITPDHLDRHGTMAAYAAAKARLFEMQIPADTAVIGQDDRLSRDIADVAVARMVGVSAVTVLDEGVSVVDGRMTIGGKVEGRQADWPALAGPHNAQNAAAAIAVCLRAGDRPRRDRRRARAPTPACRTGWSGCARSAASPMSTTARRPTRRRPPRRSPRFRTSTGSPAGWPRPATSTPACPTCRTSAPPI